MELNQITLPAAVVADSVAFYRLLGCDVVVESAHYARFKSPQGEATFSVHLRDAEAAHEDAQTVVYFECGALDMRVAELQALGIVFEQMPRDEPWLWREARLHDPAGNRLCLYRAGDMRLNPPWRVGGQRAGALQATPLTTPRLLLRALQHDDLDAMHTFNSDPEVTRYLPYAPWQTAADATAWYHRICARMLKGEVAYRVLVEQSSGRVLGSCILLNHAPDAQVEIGYLLGREFQGKGFIQEAARAVITDAFASLPVRRIEAHIDARNRPSQRVVESLGFQREALLRDAWKDHGEVSDATIYGLLRREWKV